MASKKKRVAESIHDRDRIIVRLPDGMRDKVADMAQANGRSMTAEVVAALEQHLQSKDRVSQLWETHQRHFDELESRIALIWEAVENLEVQAAAGWKGEFRGGLRRLEKLRRESDEVREAAELMKADQTRER